MLLPPGAGGDTNRALVILCKVFGESKAADNIVGVVVGLSCRNPTCTRVALPISAIIEPAWVLKLVGRLLSLLRAHGNEGSSGDHSDEGDAVCVYAEAE